MGQTDWPHAGHRERLRKFVEENTLKNVPPYLVIEFILAFAIPYKDTKPIAYGLLEKFGSVKRIMTAETEDLLTVKNMTKNAALLLRTYGDVYEMFYRDLSDVTLLTSNNLLPYLRSIFASERTEKLILISLDDDHNILSCDTLATGKINSVVLPSQTVMDTVLRTRAKKIILAHNHPSKFVMPSEADFKSTAYISEMLKKINVKFIDHFILTDDCAFSFYMRCKMATDDCSVYPFYKHEEESKGYPEISDS